MTASAITACLRFALRLVNVVLFFAGAALLVYAEIVRANFLSLPLPANHDASPSSPWCAYVVCRSNARGAVNDACLPRNAGRVERSLCCLDALLRNVPSPPLPRIGSRCKRVLLGTTFYSTRACCPIRVRLP